MKRRGNRSTVLLFLLFFEREYSYGDCGCYSYDCCGVEGFWRKESCGVTVGLGDGAGVGAEVGV